MKSKRKRLEESILRAVNGHEVNSDILDSLEKEVIILIADFYEDFSDVERRDMLIYLVKCWWKDE